MNIAGRLWFAAAVSAWPFGLVAQYPNPRSPVPSSAWVSLFNGRDLTGWTVKIAGHEPGANYGNTFRVEDGIIRVAYDAYDSHGGQFGHLFYDIPYSWYHLVVEYRFTGAPVSGTPDWAIRNSGVMLHAQAPATMLRDQDFPISIEMQFLGGLGNGRPRTTGNMCSPGTEVFIGGSMARSHCANSTSRTFDGDRWVRVEAIVLGDSLIRHIVDGDTVLVYSKPQIGGGTVNGFDPAVKRDGTPLTAGYIALQSEGHPIEFRRVDLLDLTGCKKRRRPQLQAMGAQARPVRVRKGPDAGDGWTMTCRGV